jgi:O-acetyl-ADP-ribose deacetylase (regulator of RNase III)
MGRPQAATAGGSAIPIIVHVEPVELLTNVDIIVVPENIYLELPQPFKSSVSAAVRSGGAIRRADGEIVADVIGDELRSWVAQHGRPGLPVALGTVVPTSPGQLLRRGIRRIYHAAVVSPRPGTNRYDVDLTAIASSVRNAMALARQERPRFEPELSSIGFPLLGAGRGALDPAISLAWLWASLSRDLAENGPWEIHFITRHQVLADLIVSKLTTAGATPARQDSSGGRVPDAG